jgi:hypothetical protein
VSGEKLSTGAEARLVFGWLYAALKRRSSTVVHAAVFHIRARALEMHVGAEFAVYATVEERPF